MNSVINGRLALTDADPPAKPRAMRALGWSLALPLFALAASCKSADDAPPAPPPPVIACSGNAARDAWPAVEARSVAIAVDGSGAEADRVRADVTRVLAELWGLAPAAVSAAPDAADVVLRVSTSTEVGAKVGARAGDAYVLSRADEGRPTLVAWGRDEANASYAAYAMLEELGARFFHPMQDHVPRLGAARLPPALDVHRATTFTRRGIQVHSLHPIEYTATFFEPSAAHADEARRLVDWLVKTGQNHLQLFLLQSVDWPAFVAHMRPLVDYAHARHVTVGAVVQLWGGASLQNATVLTRDEASAPTEIPAQLEKVFEVPWDGVDLALGEFLSAGPEVMLSMLDLATQTMKSRWPAAQVHVHNHVGNYPELWVDYKGERSFYYHLPRHLDAHLGAMVHTLAYYDVYRPWAMYGHPDFSLQREYMLSQLGKRKVSYFPESAYWIGTDVDVPLFLAPEYLRARWLDVSGLTRDARERGLPPLDGHVMFSSGHEWGYWMIDYLTARMLWQPDAPFEAITAHVTDAWGSCGPDAARAFAEVERAESELLFDKRLMPYMQGEDGQVDFGARIGIEIRPRRVPYEAMLTMSDADRAGFERDVVEGLESFAARLSPVADDLAARCRGSDEPLRAHCEETASGVVVLVHRARHAASLYRAALARARGQDGRPLLSRAAELRVAAEKVITDQAKRYRFDVERLTGAYKNPTRYPFGYLRQAHTVCFWHRQEAQAKSVVEDGEAAPLQSLRSCTD